MSRPLRLEFHGALYHLTARGDGREDIFWADADRVLFLDVLANVVEQFNWTVYAHCLMGNHYHLLVETPDGNLSQGMRQLNGVYTQRINRGHQRVGHVFQGRYKAIIVQKESYLLELARYIVLNPVRARMVRSANEWPWSSYRATAGLAEVPDWLSIDWILSAFSVRRGEAIRQYQSYVAEARDQPCVWEQLKNQIYLGSDAFVQAVQATRPANDDLSEIPLPQRCQPAKPLASYVQQCSDRAKAMAMAYKTGGYTLKEIGEHFGVHYSRVSRIVAAHQEGGSK